MGTLPKLRTASEIIAEDYENDPRGTLTLAIISSFGASTSYSRLPEYNDQNEVERKATEDFRRADYSDATTYVDSLVKIADHYQELAQQYLDILAPLGIVTGYYGDLKVEPFAVMRGGEWLVGNADSFNIENEDQQEDARDYLTRFGASTTNEAYKAKAALLIAELNQKIEARA